MRSARRRKLIEKKKKAVKNKSLFLKICLPIILLIVAFLFIKLSIKYWNGTDKFSIVYKLDDGNVAVGVFDPKLEEITSLIIPGDTEVNLARNFGTLRIKNVWQFGINEKIGGSLLASTVTQNFLFPVSLWSDSDAQSLYDANALGIVRFVFFPKYTNISLGDRISVGLFALKIKNLNKNLIDIGKSQFLSKQKLNDGEEGYTLSGTISPRLTAYFSDNSFAASNTGKSLRVEIKDMTGKPGVADKIGEIVEAMGGKVVSINKTDTEDSDCIVSGMDSEVIKKVTRLFDCRSGSDSGGFDLKIELGQAFAERF